MVYSAKVIKRFGQTHSKVLAGYVFIFGKYENKSETKSALRVQTVNL